MIIIGNSSHAQVLKENSLELITQGMLPLFCFYCASSQKSQLIALPDLTYLPNFFDYCKGNMSYILLLPEFILITIINRTRNVVVNL